MSNAQEAAVAKFTEALFGFMDKSSNATADSKRQSFEEAMRDALETLSKQEVIEILFFVVNDHELFFDIFEQSVKNVRS